MQTIMIVEDEKVIRDAIVQELEKWNYEVVAVEDFSQVYTHLAFIVTSFQFTENHLFPNFSYHFP